MIKENLILQLATFPATAIGLNKFRKELIKVGNYNHPSTNQKFSITSKTLTHWVNEFNRWVANGNKVPVPPGHDNANDPEKNQGWVTSMFVEEDSLYGILELLNPDLALTTDVSISVPAEFTDSKGIKYILPITHVALTTFPVVTGLKDFVRLSLSKGGKNMDFLKKLAESLGLKDKDVTEDAVILALENVKKVKPKDDSTGTIDPVVKLVGENRDLKLSNLVKAGLITPAIKDTISAKYVDTKVLALSMATKQDDGFDLLYEVLKENRVVALEERSGVQSLELANQSTEQPNAMAKEISKRREAAGMKK